FGFSLESASEELETETLIARVASGQLDLTVADTHIFAVQRLLYPNVGGALALAKLQEEGSTDWTLDGRPGDKGSKSIAFAVRPDSSNLRSALNRFVKSHFRGLEYNMLRNRYFGNKKRAAQASEERAGKSGTLSPFDELIKRYSEQYDLDWRLMSSLAYQESRFDPKARSWVGAQGLFQVMPATGKELGFRDLMDPEQGAHAGIKYVHQLIDHFEPTLEFRQRVRFALASYNAGFGHVGDARRLAQEEGLDPNRWFGNVEKAMLMLQQPRYYRRARYGFVRGQEPVNYVSQIQLRYDNYVKVFPK
ncbi:MAG: transglycosylase SLT domain-containing protein, partial [Myxococcota bacterium]